MCTVLPFSFSTLILSQTFTFLVRFSVRGLQGEQASGQASVRGVKSIGIAGVDLVQKQDSCDPEVGRTGSCQRYPGLDSLMFDVGEWG